MHRPSSSTSSSKRGKRLRLRAVLVTGGWALLALAVIDAAVQIVFPMPSDARKRPSSIAQYFHYGLSTDAKLAQMLGPTDALSTPVTVAGWIDRECRSASPPPVRDQLGITFYGMSFTGHVAAQLRKIDPGLAVSTYGGPGAPLNHSYACFRSVTANAKDGNQVQVIGVLASAVAQMLTIGGLTTSFESPAPFTYPRYHLDGDRLTSVEPLVRSPADLRDPEKMAAYRAQMAQEDVFFDPLLMNASPLDHSITVALVRRAYAQAEARKVIRNLVGDGKSFSDNADIGPVMRAMLLDFARTVRSQGKVPMVLLLQDQGTGTDSLYRMLGPTLERAGVPLVSTHEIAPVTDPRNFLPDGHFTPAVDHKIARAMLAKVREAVVTRPLHQRPDG